MRHSYCVCVWAQHFSICVRQIVCPRAKMVCSNTDTNTKLLYLCPIFASLRKRIQTQIPFFGEALQFVFKKPLLRLGLRRSRLTRQATNRSNAEKSWTKNSMCKYQVLLCFWSTTLLYHKTMTHNANQVQVPVFVLTSSFWKTCSLRCYNCTWYL